MTCTPRSATRGLTLVDLLCVLAVTAVLMGGAMPGWQALKQSLLLRSVADTVETDIQYARTVAMTTDRTVRLAVQAHPAGGSCTLVHLGGSGSCSCDTHGQAVCTGDGEALRVSEQRAIHGVTLTTVDKSLVFDAGKGTISPTATLKLQDAQGRELRQIVNILGRVRYCSPQALVGTARCA